MTHLRLAWRLLAALARWLGLGLQNWPCGGVTATFPGGLLP